MFSVSDIELVQECISGNRSCQEKFYNKFASKMYNVCLAYSNSREDAKDIMQDGFVKVFTSLKKFNREGSLEGWIRRTIVNTAIDFYRKRTKEKKNIDIEHVHNLSVEFSVLDSMEAKQLMELVQRLPEGAKLIFNLHVVEGYTHEEIAGQLNISVGTSKSQVNRAKSLLQNWIIQFSSVKVAIEGT